jgi:GT2 family glycosyltransferase
MADPLVDSGLPGCTDADMTCSVLIPSFRRPQFLSKCLRALASQTRLPDEVIVVWQADDTATRDAGDSQAALLPYRLIVVHHPVRGVVPSENAALASSCGEIVLLIDDDAIPPPDWVDRHLSHYVDNRVGAVGGPADNFNPDGSTFPRHASELLGRIGWTGRVLGNMFDHPPEWRNRAPRRVQHLVGYNLSLRRKAFDRFDDSLREYWQLFELDVCLQVSSRGYHILFDFGLVVEHHPTNTAYCFGRDGDLNVKVYNPAFNHAYIVARHFPLVRRWASLARMLLIGSTNTPGVLASPVAIRRYGAPRRELGILLRTWSARVAGFRAGRVSARAKPARSRPLGLPQET